MNGVRVYSVGIHVIICSFLLSGFLENGTAPLLERFTLTWMENLFEPEGAVILNMFMDVSVSQEVDSAICTLITRNGKDRAGIQPHL